MKFSHLSDCHIGGWKENTLRDINLKSFSKAIDLSVESNVDFILISGDLFDVALPSIDILKETTKILSKIKQNNIPVYLIPGSHDFSSSGKTMLDVLENAGLVINVMKLSNNALSFTIDKSGVKLAGFYGKKGGLEKSEYSLINKTNLESEDGIKIFLFHSLLNELKPKNFSYYAGGHPHFVYCKYHEDYGHIAYPGPIFPNNFQELEVLKYGGFFIVEINDRLVNAKHIKLPIKEVLSLVIDAENKAPMDVESEIISKLRDNCDNKIVTLRIEGCLKSGKTGDINFRNINEIFSSAYCILRNTSKLSSKDFEEIELDSRNVNDIETSIIKEHALKSNYSEITINEVMKSLDKDKNDGEKNADFESRIVSEVSSVLGLLNEN